MYMGLPCTVLLRCHPHNPCSQVHCVGAVAEPVHPAHPTTEHCSTKGNAGGGGASGR